MRASAAVPVTVLKPQLVLCVGLGDELTRKLAPVLARSEFEVAAPSTLAHAIRLVQVVRFDAVLIAHGAEDDELQTLLASVRSPGSASLRSSVALLLPRAEMPMARAYLAAGANQVVPDTLGSADLQSVVLGMLRAKVRLEVRVMARLSVRLGETIAQRLCQTRDLSRNGMFVITGDRFPLGSPVQFTLELARTGDTVRGEALVVRQTDATRDRPDGLGLSFLAFAGDGESRLMAFLDQLRG